MSESPSLPLEMVEAVRTLLTVGGEGIDRLSAAIREIGPGFFSHSERANRLKVITDHTLKLSVDEIIIVFDDFLIPLQRLRAEATLSSSELYEMVSDDLANLDDQQWPLTSRKTWEGCRPNLEALLGLDLLLTELRANEVLFDRSNWVERLAIMSELKPVFNTSNGIEAMVISNTLRVEYCPTGRTRRTRTLYFAIDPVDLDTLEKQIEQAREWNARLAKQVEGTSIPVLKLEGERA